MENAWIAFGIYAKKPEPMRKATLTRYETGPEGTYGKLVTDNGFQCSIMELPWADNKPEISCILPGDYECRKVESARFGSVYKLVDSNGRTEVLIHAANWPRQIRGCLAPGRAVGLVLGIKGVMSSRDALNGLEADLDAPGPFLLTIKWEPHLDPKSST